MKIYFRILLFRADQCKFGTAATLNMRVCTYSAFSNRYLQQLEYGTNPNSHTGKQDRTYTVSSNHAQMLRGDDVTCMAAFLVFQLITLKQEHSIAIAVSSWSTYTRMGMQLLFSTRSLLCWRLTTI